MNLITHTTPGLAAAASTDEILEKKELAKRLKISTRCLDEWMRNGIVPFWKLNKKTVRFRWHDVLSKLESMNRVN